jgi:hypothetical protein
MREEVGRPLGDLPEGIKGVVVLVDEGSSRQIFITLFESREAMEAAEAAFERMGDEISEDVRGKRVSREYWDVPFGMIQLG